MIPHGVDIAELSEQLAEDRLAIGPHAEFGRVQEPQLLDAVSTISEGAAGQDIGIALVDIPVDKAADLRDVAQELQIETGIETVIVRTPSGGAAVSENYSRASLEAAESAFADVPTNVGLVQFMDELSHPLVSWPIFAATCVLVMFVALTISWLLVTKSLRN